MEILLLGVGLQGKAALYDLVRQPQVKRVIAADMNEVDLKAYVEGLQTDKVTSIHLNRSVCTVKPRWMMSGRGSGADQLNLSDSYAPGLNLLFRGFQSRPRCLRFEGTGLDRECSKTIPLKESRRLLSVWRRAHHPR